VLRDSQRADLGFDARSDCVRPCEPPRYGAGLSNVATIIGDLLPDGVLDPAELAAVGAAYPSAVVQRTGYLVDLMAGEVGVDVDTAPLRDVVAGCRYRVLSPAGGAGLADPRWRVVVNTSIEHDL
jgi:predicted transcriptional regulator of viral defense system